MEEIKDTKKKLNILHLASFMGNIGDNANHSGSRYYLRKNLDFELNFTELEIRDFFYKKKKYDASFAELANKYDLLLIGGGNYFELWVESSATGTSIDISKEILNQIKIPIVFYALGVDPGQGVTDDRINRFRGFLDQLFSSQKALISVRNDGAMSNLKKYVGDKYASKIYAVPDGGFFTQVKDFFHPELPPDKKIIGINIAGDMLDVRFDNANPDMNIISSKEFLTQFSSTLSKIMNDDEDLHIVIFPHIFRDLDFISKLLNEFPDNIRRRRITVAPYLTGDNSQEYIFDAYRKCDLILGTRFHANVCGIGQNIPTIGLSCYIQIESLYKELDYSKYCVKINESGFETELNKLIRHCLNNKSKVKEELEEINKKLVDDINSFHSIMNNWLKEQFHVQDS